MKIKSGSICLAFLTALIWAGSCEQPSSQIPETIPYDPDLYAWRTASWTPFTVSDPISGFAWGRVNGKNRYVAVAKTGLIAWSSEGDVWHKANITGGSLIPVFNDVAYGSGIFIAVGTEGGIAVSVNGKDWTTDLSGRIPGFGNTVNINSISYGNDVFVAVGGDAGEIAYFSDRDYSWTYCGDGRFGRINDIAYSNSNGAFYIVADNGVTGYSTSPSDGWIHYKYNNRDIGTYPDEKSDPGYPFFGNNLISVACGRYGDSIGIAVAFEEWGGRKLAIASTGEFNNWDADINPGNFGTNRISSITYGGSLFTVAGTSAMIGYWPGAEPSNESERYWRALTFPEFQYWEISIIEALNGRFFIGGVGGKIGYSK